MTTPYVGEIRMFAGNFAPVGWNFCDGSTLPISEYDVLFAVLGTVYGGDGQSNFNVPDLRGRVPIHQGSGGGASYSPGQVGGTEQVTLTTQQLPSHNHPLIASNAAGDTSTPKSGETLSSNGPSGVSPPTYIPYDGENQVTLSNASIGIAGGSQPHSNIQPTLAVNFIIALYGIYPSPG